MSKPPVIAPGRSSFRTVIHRYSLFRTVIPIQERDTVRLDGVFLVKTVIKQRKREQKGRLLLSHIYQLYSPKGENWPTMRLKPATESRVAQDRQ